MALPREELVLHRLQGVYMAPIYDLVKDRRVYSIDADRTVLEGARYMMEHNIGALPVLRNGELAGIFSERDIMNRVVAVGRLPGTTQISEVMTPNPKTVPPDESVEDCLFLMREFGFRHVLIADGKQLKGLASLRDILLRYISQQESEKRRIAGRPRQSNVVLSGAGSCCSQIFAFRRPAYLLNSPDHEDPRQAAKH